MMLWWKSCGKHPLLNQSLNCGAVFILDRDSKLATVFDFLLFSRNTEDDKGFLPYEGVKHDSHSTRSNTSHLTGSHSKPNIVLFKPTIHFFFIFWTYVLLFPISNLKSSLRKAWTWWAWLLWSGRHSRTYCRWFPHTWRPWTHHWSGCSERSTMSICSLWREPAVCPTFTSEPALLELTSLQ